VKIDDLLKKLHTGIETLVSGDDWKRALVFQSKFHRYSFGNILLIASQRPGATLVRGFRQWQDMGRQVRKGEKGISILRPNVGWVTDEATGEKKRIVRGFGVATVFDITQTDGDPLPLDVLSPEELEGDASHDLFQNIRRQLLDRKYVVEDADEDRLGSAKGSTRPAQWDKDAFGLVLVKRNASELQRIKTLVHELAHVILHMDKDYDYRGHRGIAETEAESVAFVVCGALGLPTDDYSFAYVGNWSQGDMELVKKTGERVAKTAKTILAEFE